MTSDSTRLADMLARMTFGRALAVQVEELAELRMDLVHGRSPPPLIGRTDLRSDPAAATPACCAGRAGPCAGPGRGTGRITLRRLPDELVPRWVAFGAPREVAAQLEAGGGSGPEAAA